MPLTSGQAMMLWNRLFEDTNTRLIDLNVWASRKSKGPGRSCDEPFYSHS